MILDLIFASVIYAHNFNSLPSKAPLKQPYNVEQQSKKIYPKSVDEILEGTRFAPVCSNNYVKEISKGNAAVFVYNQGDGIGYRNGIEIDFEKSKAMAEVLRRVVKDFPEETGIKFLKFDADCDAALGNEGYQRLTEKPYNIKRSPSVKLFRDGKLATETPRIVPTFEESVLKEWENAMRENITYFLLNGNN